MFHCWLYWKAVPFCLAALNLAKPAGCLSHVREEEGRNLKFFKKKCSQVAGTYNSVVLHADFEKKVILSFLKLETMGSKPACTYESFQHFGQQAYMVLQWASIGGC